MKTRMTNRLLNIFPIGTASLSGGGMAWHRIDQITWGHLGNTAFDVAVAAIIGGIIGWGVKHCLDWCLKKYKERKK